MTRVIKGRLARLRWLRDTGEVLRMNEWHGKILIVSVIVVLSAVSGTRAESLADIAAPLAITWLYLFLFLGFSYVLNTLTDVAEDQVTGKDRTFGFRRPTLSKIAATLGLLQFLPLAFSGEAVIPVALLVGINLVFSATYSLAKFKTKGWTGLIAPSLCQRPAPFVLFVLLRGGGVSSLDLFFAAWLTLVGAHSVFLHQVTDRENDARSGVSTLAVGLGVSKANRLLHLLSGAVVISCLTPFLLFPLRLATVLFLLLLSLRMKILWQSLSLEYIGGHA